VTTPARAGISENRTTTLSYDGDGYLQSITGPVPGSTVGFTYDGYGRPRTITNSDNYTVTLEYDDLDRPRKVHYPNGTYEEVVWDKLDPKTYRDLLGRVTEVVYDAARRPTAVRDPAGRTTNLFWCGCGGLERIIDGNGNATRFDRDEAGRVVRETRADGSYVARTYETTTSRVSSLSDPRAKRNYTHNVDGTLERVDYVDAVTNQPNPNTAPVSFTYDPVYRRLATRVDRTGTTLYGYNPVALALGSGRLGNIDGPLPNDTITYGYDELGRVKQRGINGVFTSVIYDTLGRVSNVTNPLGPSTTGTTATRRDC
jgi:YD repeat-containing protein